MLTFDELVDFIDRRMRMSHIYQPLLIRTLVDTGGTPSPRLAASPASQVDEPNWMGTPAPPQAGHVVARWPWSPAPLLLAQLSRVGSNRLGATSVPLAGTLAVRSAKGQGEQDRQRHCVSSPSNPDRSPSAEQKEPDGTLVLWTTCHRTYR